VRDSHGKGKERGIIENRPDLPCRKKLLPQRTEVDLMAEKMMHPRLKIKKSISFSRSSYKSLLPQLKPGHKPRETTKAYAEKVSVSYIKQKRKQEDLTDNNGQNDNP